MIKIIAVSLLTLASIAFFPGSRATAADYPIVELGNCRDEQSCKIYCDDFSHLDECLDYAEANNLMDPEELRQARIASPYIQELGCNSKTSCQKICSQDENLMKCVELGYKLGEVSEEDYKIMRQTGGKGPGGCKLDACRTYCDDESHLEECVDFAVKTGMMSATEAETVRKTGFHGPGNCSGKSECDQYCQKEENFRECVSFGASRGLISQETAEIVITAGSTDRSAVERYCNSSPEIFKKCRRMLVSQGEMTQAEVDRENTVLQFTGQHCGVTVFDQTAVMNCLKNFCSQDANIEECWQFDISTGQKTQADYDAWLNQRREMEARAKEEAESADQSGNQPQPTP
ncbi:MAG: hypothetical protein M1586_01910 [Patescibacteria group bacterium]|nr:hypothetical protein [Patescibacteria group bacterium]MCL5262038.1 hypothetical protein [Patescibacteria group bacterium]